MMQMLIVNQTLPHTNFSFFSSSFLKDIPDLGFEDAAANLQSTAHSLRQPPDIRIIYMSPRLFS